MLYLSKDLDLIASQILFHNLLTFELFDIRQLQQTNFVENSQKSQAINYENFNII